ncbi:DUF6152 family protein [Pseudomonas sp. UBA2684]|uniref:DUF6152 family protein n=1 Tax=Pseudomonas sp. UBA2684 TaxID=1947311 RepID=UPI000E95D89A|nr:DUF6152 family protein [Pseudomonas sp. UBA2684]HBX56758.1 hypothetical protein [Pseudomonas sp.]|tara:strand:- start:6123 stop:6479 length:357 start_codon:yes stop_codon:yes gene_type:complete
MRKSLTLALGALLVSLCASLAQAHHGWSAYDAEQLLTLEVPLKTVNYRNPHADVSIEHAGKAWAVILAPISRLQARGLPEGDLTVGKSVTIVGYPRKDGSAEIRAERIIVDGRTIELR